MHRIQIVMLLCLALVAPVQAQSPPAQGAADILAALDRAPLDPERLRKARQTLAAPAPTGLDNTALADFHLGRARAAHELGLVGPRIAELRRAIELGGGSKPHRVWAALAGAELRGGNIRNALEARKQAREEAEPEMEGFLRGQHVQLAKLYLKLGDLETARKHMAEAQSHLQALREKPGWRKFGFQWSSDVEDGLGQLESAVGHFAQAEAHFRKAMELADKGIELAAGRAARTGARPPTAPENQRDWMEAHLANALRAQDRLREAEFHARNTAYRAIARSGQDGMHVAEILGPLAQVLTAQRRGTEALQLIDHALRKLDALGVPPTAYGYVSFRRHRAGALSSLGRWSDALVEFEAMQAALSADPELAETLGAPSLGWIRALIATGQADKALALATQLEARQRERMGADAFPAAEARGFLGVALATLGRDAEALVALRAAVAVMIPATGEVERSGSRFGRFSYIIQSYLALLARVRGTALEKSSGIDAAAEAFVAADVLRGMSVQQAMLASSLRAAAATPELAEMVRGSQDSGEERDALYRILADLISRPADQVLPRVVEDIKARADNLDRQQKKLQQEIGRRYPAFADLATPRPATIDELQAVLRPGEALLSVGFTELGAYIWAIPAQGRAEFATSPLTRRDIRKLAGSVRAAVDPADFDVLRLPQFDAVAARRLHDELLLPVRAGWQGAKHLFVATGTHLAKLPFALLLTAAPPRRRWKAIPSWVLRRPWV